MSDKTQPHERSNLRLKAHEIMWNNFVGGIFWSLGATVGLSLIIALLTIIAQNVNFQVIPVIGSFISQIIDFVLTHNRNLQR